MTADSGNIIPSYYAKVEEAMEIAFKLRRNSILLKDTGNHWRVVLPNNRAKLFEDVSLLNGKNNGVILINDVYGNIVRDRVSLKEENITYYAKITSIYDGSENYLKDNVPGLSSKIKNLIVKIEQKETEKDSQSEKKEEKSGIFEISPVEVFCYFKSFRPISLKIEQEVEADCYQDFRLHLIVNDKKGLEVTEPLIRKAGYDYDQGLSYLERGKKIELKISLKAKALERIKDKMLMTDLDNLFKLETPLKKSFLADLINYELEEFNPL